MTTDLSRALSIPDHRWPTEPELRWLAKQASYWQEGDTILELGCYVGRSTVAMATNTAANVVVVDDFYGPRDVDMPEEDRAQILNDFLANTAHLRNVGIFVRDHAEPPAIEADMIFIDGAHDYESVVRDITYWKTMVKPGGLLCGHDLDWPAVRKAVVDIFGDEGVVSVPHTNIWYAA